jgi:mannosyltransferase
MATPPPGQAIASARHAAPLGSVRAKALPRGWLLASLLLVAAAARLPTLAQQSLWYDEAYTPVHVLHASLAATLHSVSTNENTPPLWYILEWAVSRVLGTGVVALRLLSAIAGLGLVAIGWMIGAELASRRTAIVLSAILALNPLYVWYSQEARAYELYALASAVSLLYFLRARRSPTRSTLALWAASSVTALLCHYFAVFLVGPETLLLLAWSFPSRLAGRSPFTRRAAAAAGDPALSAPKNRAASSPALAAVASVTACGAALVPLVLAQAGRGTQWIGHWALSDRLVQTVGYYLLGANGSVLGHGLLALSALPLLATAILAARLIARSQLHGAELDSIALLLALGIGAILMPLALALAGADYFAPRNLIADWIPISAAFALVLGSAAAARAGPALAVIVCLAGAAVLVATDLDARLQRSDWSAVANGLRRATSDRAIVSVELAAAPLEYYLPGLHLRYFSRRLHVSVREVDLVGYAPLRAPIRPPTPAFALASRTDMHGLITYRYLAPAPQRLSGRLLRRLTITVGARATSETLVPAAVAAAGRGSHA